MIYNKIYKIYMIYISIWPIILIDSRPRRASSQFPRVTSQGRHTGQRIKTRRGGHVQILGESQEKWDAEARWSSLNPSQAIGIFIAI